MYKILIADDEKMERDLIRYLLTRDFPGRFQILEASKRGRGASFHPQGKGGHSPDGCADALSQWN